MFRVLPVALVALLALAGAADAAPKKTKLVELRVEGDGETLDEGTWYATGAQEIKGARKPNCQRRPRVTRFPGASALTVLGRAQLSNPALDPVRTRPTDFGPQVCQAGDVKSFGVYPSANAGFLYHVNYESGFSSADLAKVKDGDSVLWHYSVFGSDPPEAGDPPPVNTGCALQLHDVPAQDDDGEFTVRVTAHGFGCQSTDAGVTIAGADVSSPTGAGLYDVSVGDGTTELYAERGQDVRSNRYSACVGEAAQCPDAHGRTIVGSKKADGLSGTAGFDAVRAAGGDDLVNLRQGGHDRANCGGGDDVVRLKRGDGDDRVRGNCERIRRS